MFVMPVCTHAWHLAVELTLGCVLGRGGFAYVSEVRKITLKNNRKTQQETDEENGYHITKIVQDRTFMATHCIHLGKDARYAIKQLGDHVLNDPHLFVCGIMDLAIETKFLSVIQHPNIIKMRAVADGSPYSRDYFVVLDRLYDTLTMRLTSWKTRKPGGLRKLMDSRGKKATELWVERIIVARDIACALKYLHGLK